MGADTDINLHLGLKSSQHLGRILDVAKANITDESDLHFIKDLQEWLKYVPEIDTAVRIEVAKAIQASTGVSGKEAAYVAGVEEPK
jgi:hypothetical protein